MPAGRRRPRPGNSSSTSSLAPTVFRRTADALLAKRNVVDPQVLIIDRVAVTLETHVEAVEARRRKPAVREIMSGAGTGRGGVFLHVCNLPAVNPELHFVGGD